MTEPNEREALGGDWEWCPVCGGQFDGAEWRDSDCCPKCESPKAIQALAAAITRSMEP